MKKFVRFLAFLTGILLLLPFSACDSTEKDKTPADTGIAEVTEAAPITEIILDGGYSPIAVESGKYEYDVEVPLGNPRIPAVSADVEGAYVDQDFCLQGTGTAGATLCFTKEGKEYTYKVNFIPGGDEAELQYGDNRLFEPDYELKDGESFKFESGDIYTVYIDDDGYYFARKLSNEPVTLTAKVNGTVVDTLVIKRVVKAEALYVVFAGGLNATADFGDKSTADAPREGIMYTAVSDTGAVKKCTSVGGILPSFAKNWYALTNEKVIAGFSAVYNSAMADYQSSGACLESALNGLCNTTEKNSGDSSNFEIRHFGLIYLGGENDHDADAVEYADTVIGLIDALEEIHPLDFCAIIPCRASCSYAKGYGTKLVQLDGPRVAAFSLHNYRENIFIGSLAAEEANLTNELAEKDNVRLSQKCYDAIGTDVASTAFARMNGTGSATETLVLLGADGNTLESGSSVTPDGKSIAAYTLPLTATERINVSTDGNGIVTSQTGIVCVNGTTSGGSAVYKTADKSVSITLSAYTRTAEENTDPLASLSLREKTIYVMKEMGTVEWKSVTDMKHGNTTWISSAYIAQKGIPYGSDRSTLEDFKKQLVDGYYFGPSVFTVSNNCTSAMVIALAAADPKLMYMVSSEVDQTSSYLTPLFSGYGVSKLGDYVVTIPSLCTEHTVVTKPILDENGRSKMYDCYALLEPGDYVVMRKGNNNSHCRLVVSNTVTKSSTGKIMGGTLTCIEQGAGLVQRGTAYTTYSTSSKVSYSDLFEGYYVPMTLDVYHK